MKPRYEGGAKSLDDEQELESQIHHQLNQTRISWAYLVMNLESDRFDKSPIPRKIAELVQALQPDQKLPESPLETVGVDQLVEESSPAERRGYVLA